MSAAMAPEAMGPSDGTVDGDALTWKAALTQPMPMTLDFPPRSTATDEGRREAPGTFGNATFEGTRACRRPPPSVFGSPRGGLGLRK
jgi:hypothetical protein